MDKVSAELDSETTASSGEVDLSTGREGQRGIDAEKVMPSVQKDKTFECGKCGVKVVDKTHRSVCVGVTLGVALRLPDGSYAIYTNGVDDNGDPIMIDGAKVVQVTTDNEVFSHDGKEKLVDGAWKKTEHGGAWNVPGSHSPEVMKEVKS